MHKPHRQDKVIFHERGKGLYFALFHNLKQFPDILTCLWHTSSRIYYRIMSHFIHSTSFLSILGAGLVIHASPHPDGQKMTLALIRLTTRELDLVRRKTVDSSGVFGGQWLHWMAKWAPTYIIAGEDRILLPNHLSINIELWRTTSPEKWWICLWPTGGSVGLLLQRHTYWSLCHW